MDPHEIWFKEQYPDRYNNYMAGEHSSSVIFVYSLRSWNEVKVRLSPGNV